MKKSNIILICVAVLTVSWFLISGWLQANAYTIITSGKTCSYAYVSGLENQKQLAGFKNIKIDIADVKLTPILIIRSGQKTSLSYSSKFKNALSSFVRLDTLYVTINKNAFGDWGSINVITPELKSVTITTSPYATQEFKNSGLRTIISDFKGNTLSVFNEGPNNLSLDENQFKRINIKGAFDKGREVEITKSTVCDSLDIDIEGQKGSLIIGNSYFKTEDYTTFWTSIKVPGSFRVSASATVASKIILKK
jgi:hypothetical protein